MAAIRVKWLRMRFNRYLDFLTQDHNIIELDLDRPTPRPDQTVGILIAEDI